ncbi:MAG: DNA mismatch repair protein MutS, partial [Lachnospiraceae bacterium]|nr:DNA mismatch repair protein MutS [Lachnospiraceae bacterium]
ENIVNARMTFDKESLKPTYRMVIGEAGESCAFYIAERLGMPGYMLETAAKAAYGEDAAKGYSFGKGQELKKKFTPKITKVKKTNVNANLSMLYNIGDSVMVYPEKKIGIVCETVNDKGTLRVQVAGRKFWINHKRVKLYVKAEELYPEDYDFSIIFDSVEERKIRHDMQRKYTEEVLVTEE